MIYLDCHASIGMNGPTDQRVKWKMSQLLDDMEHSGIHGSLVYHWTALEYDPAYGNRRLLEEIAETDRLFPCWILLPHHTDEMARGAELVAAMLELGVPAAKMFPRRHHYRFDEQTCGEIFSALENAGLPLLLDVGFYGDDLQVTFEEVDNLCTNHPGLPVLLQKARWESTRDVVALMERHQSLHIEFSSFQIHYGMEYMKSKVGTERMLLGTEWPFKSPGAARSFIDYCELTQSEKEQVAGSNLARLLGLESSPAAYPEKEDGAILSLAKAGKPLDHIPVIDTHTHVLHAGLMGTGYIAIPHGDAKHMIQRNRRMGIDRFCCSSWIGIWIDYREGNELIHKLSNEYPDDIVGYATIDPKKSDDYQSDIELCHDTYGFPGIKPYVPRVGLPYNSPMYEAWYEKGNEKGSFVKLHQLEIGDNFIEEIAEISERYPNMSFFVAHSAWTWEVARQRAELARRRSNVFLDLTFTSVLHGVVEYFVDEGLADRVLFCTDAPLRDPIPQFGWVAYAEISEKHKELAFGGNALRALARAGINTDVITAPYRAIAR